MEQKTTENKGLEIDFDTAREAFLSRCLAMNLTQGSLAWYANIWRQLGDFLTSQGIWKLNEIEPRHLRDFLASLRRKGQSSQTVSRIFGAMNCGFRFWQREEFLSRNPMELVERPRKDRQLIRPLSPEQTAHLLAQTNAGTLEGLRDKGMIMLMLDSGLRISEVLSLEAGRVDWLNCTVTVMGKGRKERTVPFSSKTGQALLDYAQARSRKPVKAEAFFLGRTGKPICRSKARKLIIRYGRQAGIEGVRLSPHTLRHTFAVLYIRNGGDSFSLQEILGHSTLEMTRNYVNLARRDVAEQHKKFSPMGHLAGW